MARVVVVGIDAASWNLLEPWIRDGVLPNLKLLVEGGAYGPLESTYPFITSPAWKSFSTSKNPGKIGIFYWFFKTDT